MLKKPAFNLYPRSKRPSAKHHLVVFAKEEGPSDQGDQGGAQRSQQMMSRHSTNTERKAKQAGYQALRGPGQDIVPNQSERLHQRENAHSSDGSRAALSGTVAGFPPTAAAKAAARNAVRPGPARQGPPVPTIAPGQPAAAHRHKEKLVELPQDLTGTSDDATTDVQPTNPTDVQAQMQSENQSRGRITIYCTAETLNRDMLSKKLRARGHPFQLHAYPDVLVGRYCDLGGPPIGDIFYFDYGCVAFWGLTQKQEQDVLRNLVVPCEENPLPVSELEIDEFQFHYTANERPHIQNDTITISHKLANDHSIKLSISHALAQSTKLCVFEERVLEMVAATRNLPGNLATTGKVTLKRKEVAQLIGKVFIQKAAVNLLSTVLDTPEFFWSAPDSMQNLYKVVCDYMELDNRVEVLNNRLMVLQEMLDMLRDHQNNHHAARLELIIIWLIVIEVVVGLFECASLFGWFGGNGHL